VALEINGKGWNLSDDQEVIPIEKANNLITHDPRLRSSLISLSKLPQCLHFIGQSGDPIFNEHR
jgi:hypothetical protein